MLRALILTLDNDPSGQVRQPHRRIRCINVLSARARGAKRIDSQILFANLDTVYLLDLGQHSNRAGRGVNAALRLCFGDPLHAMRSGLEFQVAVDILSHNTGDQFFVSTVLSGALG